MPGSHRLMIRWALVALVGLGCGWLGWSGWERSRLKRAVAAARQDVEAGRFATARRDLLRLTARHPDSDEAAYLLGLCERNLGRAEAAAEAWSRVPLASPLGSQAVQGRMDLEIALGRLAQAETIVEQAAADQHADGTGLRLYLGPIYSQQGRSREALRIVEERWEHLEATGAGTSEPALNLLRLHVELRLNPAPVEAVRAFLDSMGRLAPDDDRVWLGKANLAIRTNALDEAGRLLDACEAKRPDDPAVQSARLDWAMATDRVGAALLAFGKLTARRLGPAETCRLVAWVARHRVQAEPEREALEALLALEPTDTATRERLIALARGQDRSEQAAQLRRERAEIERKQARFLHLFRRNQPMRDAAEMGRLAAILGDRFEARGYLTEAVAVDPEDRTLREALANVLRAIRDAEATADALAVPLLTVR